MKSPLSKTARTVQRGAPPCCDIWFVCKGNLICCSKDGSLDWSGVSHSPPVLSPRTRLSQAERVRHRLMPRPSSLGSLLQESENTQEPCNDNPDEDTFSPIPKAETDGTSSRSSLSKEAPMDDLPEGEPRSSQGSDTVNSVEYVEGNADALPGGKSDSSAVTMQLDEQVKFEVYEDWNVYLQQVMEEAAKLINGAYRESKLRYRAEREASEANNKAKALEVKCDKEMKEREESEELLAQTKTKMEELQQDLSEASRKNSEYDGKVKNLEEKLSAAEQALATLESERDELKKGGDRAEGMDPSGVGAERTTPNQSSNFLEISSSELKQATCNFDNLLKIGEGGSGRVFKGFLHQTSVAIKILQPQSSQEQAEFQRQVGVLCKLRHPNVTSLIGASPSEGALVYEFMPNGSLEDRLSGGSKSQSPSPDSPPLSWRGRIGISVGICSALIFLHSSKPEPIIHGDLRPTNVLLDSNLAGKVTDFGLVNLVDQSTHFNWNDPKGASAYMDPEFFSTGQLTARSDVYSFGITILRLLTGKPALGVVKEVQEALERNRLQSVLDSTAGEWPSLLAQQLAVLGLKCSEMKRRNRPDLVRDVWKMLESIKVFTSQ